MILYYTGTGNSAYAAKRIADSIGDTAENLFSRLRSKNFSALESEKPYIIVSPTYCWQLPHILRDYIRKTDFRGCRKMYFVLTCGDSAGNAAKFAEKLCAEKNMEYMGLAQIVMPENYIAMFNAPDEKKAVEIIEKSNGDIDAAAEYIKNGACIPQKKLSAFEKFGSSPLFNNMFYSVFVKADKFYANDKCIGCKKCASVCPLENIKIKDNKPQWGKNCTHCMACICSCPQEAIEYGAKSKGKPRYKCPL